MTAVPAEAIRATRSSRRLAASGVALGLVGVLFAGCGDRAAPTPLELDTTEAIPSLRIGSTLPSLPMLARDWGGELALQAPLERWERSWTADREEGAALRNELYLAILPILAEGIPEGRIEEMSRRLEFALLDVRDQLPELPRGPLLRVLDEAAVGPTRARTALERGDEAEALRHLLRAVDALQAATPEAMARTLIGEATTLLRRISGDDTYSEERRTRSARLLLGAEVALEDGNETLALRRAYYAHRLLTDDEPW